MKINIIIPGVGLTGGIRVVFKYAELLTEVGHDVVFYTPIIAYDVKNSKNELINYGHVVTNSIKRWYGYSIEKKQNKVPYHVKINVVNVISNKTIRNADIVIATAWPTAFSVAKLALEKGEKVYFIQDYEVWNNEECGKKSYTLPLHKIVISSWINQKLVEQLGGTQAPVVYDGIELDKFDNKNKEYKINSELRCLMLYHNLPKKGVLNGIAAFEKAKKQYPNISLTMFGMDASPNIPNYVKYYCNPDEDVLHDLYCKSDIFIFPSLEEGWGLTPLEAMASKCAVVGTNTGCMIDIGKNGFNSLISNVGDVEAMSNNIVQLVGNPELLKQISENAYFTVQDFSWDKALKNFEASLRRILNDTENKE